MAGVYVRGKYEILGDLTDLTTDQIDVLLVMTTYTFSDGHVDVADVSASECYGGSYARQTIDSQKAVTLVSGVGGMFDGEDVTFSSVPDQASGTQIDAAIVHKFASNDADASLICYNDFTAISGNGSNITVQWHTDGILRLT